MKSKRNRLKQLCTPYPKWKEHFGKLWARASKALVPYRPYASQVLMIGARSTAMVLNCDDFTPVPGGYLATCGDIFIVMTS